MRAPPRAAVAARRNPNVARDAKRPRARRQAAAAPSGARAVRSYEATARIAAAPQQVFDRLDDQVKLAAHMTRPSAMMGGGRMTYEFDAAGGRAVGSRIRMGGEAFGLKLFVEEVVTVRKPPHRKTWETVGFPRLLVISSYRMGFEVEPAAKEARLRVWIEYELPKTPLGRLLSPPLAALYARWCVRRMVSDAAKLG